MHLFENRIHTQIHIQININKKESQKNSLMSLCFVLYISYLINHDEREKEEKG
jgi:hypothetical protein